MQNIPLCEADGLPSELREITYNELKFRLIFKEQETEMLH